MAQHVFNPSSYIKYRTENGVPLQHNEVDTNFKKVTNQWDASRSYEEGDIVYYAESDGFGSPLFINWYRASQANGPLADFDPTNWMVIGADASGSGEPIVFDFSFCTPDAGLVFGDIVYVDGSNNILKADVSQIAEGSSSTLGIYVDDPSGNFLYRGTYVFVADDFDVSAPWTAGSLVWASVDGKLSTAKPTAIDNWVRSLGFCVPNQDGELQVYFNPESTFSTIGTQVGGALSVNGILGFEDIGDGQILVTTTSGDVVLNGVI